MKKVMIGFILGFALTLPITSIAFNNTYNQWEQEVVDLLEDIIDNGNDIYSRMDTIIDKL